MATGRIGVTPTLRTRWSKAPAGGTTSLSGLDDNSVSLVYDVGYEAVYRNGVLLSRTNDYTATTGNSITLIDATIAGDIIEVFANQLLPLTNAIGNGQYTAKGALLSATAASTPAVLTVGSNDQVLTADSSTSTGLKWATPAAGGQTLLETLTLSGASVVSSTIPGTYKDLKVIVRDYLPATDTTPLRMRFNSSSTANTYYNAESFTEANDVAWNSTQMALSNDQDNSSSNSLIYCFIPDYANTATYKICQTYSYIDGTTSGNLGARYLGGNWKNTSAITTLQFFPNSGNFTSGSVLIYGVS